MGKLVTIKPSYTGVVLIPTMRGIDAGQTFTLTDAEYAALPASVTRAITLTTSGLPDPSRRVPDADATTDDLSHVTPEMQGYVSGDATAAINAALADGRPVELNGDYTCNGQILITRNSTKVSGNGSILNGGYSGSMVKLLNVTEVEWDKSIFIDGNWQSNAVGIEMNGALRCKVGLTGDRLPTGIEVVATVAAGSTQNSSGNQIEAIIANGIKGVTFQGDGTYFASNNDQCRVIWAGAGSGTSQGITYIAYADNNTFQAAFLNLNSAGSAGVVYNTTPATDLQVYENHHLNLVVEAAITGTYSIIGGRTWQTPGMFPSRVTLRPSGSHPPTLNLQTNCDIQFINTNDGLGNLSGRPGLSQIFIGADMIASVATATLGTDWTLGIWTMPESGNSSVRFSTLIPAEWRAYRVDIVWSPSAGTGGNVDFSLDLAHLGATSSINDGSTTEIAAAAGSTTNVVVVSTVIASQAVPASTILAWGKLSRTPASGTDTATVDVRLVGFLLTRVL